MKNILIVLSVIILAVYVHMQKETDEYKQKVLERGYENQMSKSKNINSKYMTQAIGSEYMVDISRVKMEYQVCTSMNGNEAPECYCKKEDELSKIKEAVSARENAPQFETLLTQFPKEFTDKNKRVNCKFIDFN